MGLDMFMRRISPISSEEAASLRGATEKEINEKGISIFFDLDSCEECTDLAFYCKKIPAMIEKIRLAEVKEAYDIPLEADLCGQSYLVDGEGNPEFVFYWDDSTSGERKHKRVEVDERFSHYEEEMVWIVRDENIGYWRKDYDFQELIYTKFREYRDIVPENCGWHEIPPEMYSELTEFAELPPYPEDGSGIFYHEWY